MTRPGLDAYMVAMAFLASTRATCAKRAVGCVLVDSRGRVLATGYNGPPSGAQHCLDSHCPGASAAAGSDLCLAIHAEQNAVALCADTSAISAAYCTERPCHHCSKLLMATSCEKLVYCGPSEPPCTPWAWRDSGRDSAQLDYREVGLALNAAQSGLADSFSGIVARQTLLGKLAEGQAGRRRMAPPRWLP